MLTMEESDALKSRVEADGYAKLDSIAFGLIDARGIGRRGIASLDIDMANRGPYVGTEERAQVRTAIHALHEANVLRVEVPTALIARLAHTAERDRGDLELIGKWLDDSKSFNGDGNTERMLAWGRICDAK